MGGKQEQTFVPYDRVHLFQIFYSSDLLCIVINVKSRHLTMR